MQCYVSRIISRTKFFALKYVSFKDYGLPRCDVVQSGNLSTRLHGGTSLRTSKLMILLIPYSAFDENKITQCYQQLLCIAQIRGTAWKLCMQLSENDVCKRVCLGYNYCPWGRRSFIREVKKRTGPQWSILPSL
jgi:hypothetical protein